MTTLSNRAMLVSLHISAWAARKQDKRETQDVAQKHQTAINVARVNKSLLPGAETLDNIHKLVGEIRTEFYRRSLPWSHGTQIIKSSGFLEFSEVLGNYRRRFDDARDVFCVDYPRLVREAPAKMNGLFDINDYPEVDQVASKFSMRLAFMPVPDAEDWRVDVGDENLEILRDSITREVEGAASEAMTAAWQRIYDVVSKAYERLSTPDNIFKDSLVQNAVDLCRILPDLNITDDPHLEDLRRQLERSLCSTTPGALRASPQKRTEVSDQLAGIMSKMGALYGN